MLEEPQPLKQEVILDSAQPFRTVAVAMVTETQHDKQDITDREIAETNELLNNLRIEQLKRQVIKPRPNHNRSRSDLADSILITDKWMKYEEMKNHEFMNEELPAPLVEPESMCALSTLNLEKHGKFVDREDVKHYEEIQKHDNEVNHFSLQEGPILKLPFTELHLPEPMTDPAKQKRPEKRSSVTNFFNKISRAVLKPKNTEAGVKSQKLSRFMRRKSLTRENKENILQSDRLSQHSDNTDRKSNKEYKKLKTEKNKTSKQSKENLHQMGKVSKEDIRQTLGLNQMTRQSKEDVRQTAV